MPLVIDTNVWVAAAGGSEQADEHCVRVCIDAVESVRHDETLALDDRSQIANEYFARIPPGTYPEMVLREVMRQVPHVHFRTCDCDEAGDFVLPDCLSSLDPSDRKFAAVALTYGPPARIVNALDSDWRECAEGLVDAHLDVLELCANCLRDR